MAFSEYPNFKKHSKKTKNTGLTRFVFLSFEKLLGVKIGKTDSVGLFQPLTRILLKRNKWIKGI